jgi:hypothetical protein
VDDPVAKLMHMGRETCRKLSDLHSAAQQANMELDLDEDLACVEKVCLCVNSWSCSMSQGSFKKCRLGICEGQGQGCAQFCCRAAAGPAGVLHCRFLLCVP